MKVSNKLHRAQNIWQNSEFAAKKASIWLCFILFGSILCIISKSIGFLYLEIIGMFSCYQLIRFYISKPIERNRILYGKSSASMFYCVSVFVVSLVLAVSGINHIIGFVDWNADPELLTNWEKSSLAENDTVYLKTSSSQTYLVTKKHETDSSASHEVDNNKSEQVIHQFDNNSVKNFWAVISQFADPGNLPSSYGNARPFALFLAFLGIFCLSGLLMSSLVTFLSKRKEKWQKGLIHYDEGLKNYIVIIGFNEQTSAIVKHSLKRVKYVLIQTRQDVEKMRMRLDLDLDREEEDKVVFYYAERTSKEDLDKLYLEKAEEVFILGEDVSFDKEEDHDAFNIECLNLISDYFKIQKNIDVRKHLFGEENARLKCNVSFEYQSTFTAFKVTHIYLKLGRSIEFIPFNVHELWAKKVLVDNLAIIPGSNKGEVEVQRYRPLEGDGITMDSDKTVHLVIMGMNKMGTAFAVQAALLAHYPNFFKDEKHTRKTKITFIDDHAIEEGEFFRGRFATLFELSNYSVIDYAKKTKETQEATKKDHLSHLTKGDEELLDIEWEFIRGNIATEEVINYLSELAENKDKILTIAICFNHPQQSIATALYLKGNILKKANQILVYQHNSFDLLNTVAKGDLDWNRYGNMVPFGMIEGSYAGDSFDNTLAKINHYTYVARSKARRSIYSKGKEETYKYQIHKSLYGNPPVDSTLIEDIEHEWNAQGIVQKLSNIDAADSLLTKLRSMGIPNYDGNIADIENFLEGSEKNKLTEEERRNRFEALANCEHMRWMVERLIMGFRALKKEEQSEILELNDPKAKSEAKEELKKHHRAHLDICSNERLTEVFPNGKDLDKNMHHNDCDVIAFIPLVLRYNEWMNASRLLQKQSFIDEDVFKSFFIHEDDWALKFIPKNQKVPNNNNQDIVEHNFWMADAPVTQGQWEEIMGAKKTDWTSDDMPVVNVTKDEIDDFLTVLRRRTGLFFVLPSIKEWKYAALLTTKYYNKADSTPKLCIDAALPNPSRAMKEVQPNDLRIYDMLGNVWEWTRTKATRNNHENCYYFCGGSWHFKEKECDLYTDEDEEYWNSYWLPKLKSKDVGFRLIWKFDDPELSQQIEDIFRKHITERTDKKKSKLEKEAENRAKIKAFEAHKIAAVEKWLKENMVDVEEGYFVMGTEKSTEHLPEYYPESGPWIDRNAGIEETPHHFVHISKFQISSVPVTQRLWNLVMDGSSKTNPANFIGDDVPQTNISYRQIVNDFLVKLNKLTGHKFRLPTEAEWEYVAKGGHTHPMSKAISDLIDEKGVFHVKAKVFCEGNEYTKYSGSNDVKEVAWIDQTSPQVVAKKKPINENFKVYDMSGNIWEWVLDYYQADMYQDCVDGKVGNDEYNQKGYITNPVCLNDAYSAHTFRGGSWCFHACDSRCTSVNFWVETDTDDDLGFRLVLDDMREDDQQIDLRKFQDPNYSKEEQK